MKLSDISPYDLFNLAILERVFSSISVSGCLLMFLYACFSRHTTKTGNRLILLGTPGNLLCNVATFIARSALGDPTGFTCQLQGFLIQWLMPADALWTSAQAVNVHGIFTYHWTIDFLRVMEIWYLGICYGLPFVIALIFAFVDTEKRGKIYGPAVSWCWISTEWIGLRIWTFYMPIWIIIIITCILYSITGRKIYKAWKEAKRLAKAAADHADHPYNPANARANLSNAIPLVPLASSKPIVSVLPARPKLKPAPPIGQVDWARLSSHGGGSEWKDNDDLEQGLSAPATAATASSSTPVIPSKGKVTRNAAPRHTLEARSREAAIAYSRVSFLYFAVTLITWIPSSANRVYSLIYADEVAIVPEYISVIALPLQGFYNSLVYFYTARKEVRKDLEDLVRWIKNRGLGNWFRRGGVSRLLRSIPRGVWEGIKASFKWVWEGVSGRKRGLNQGEVARRISTRGPISGLVGGDATELADILSSDPPENWAG